MNGYLLDTNIISTFASDKVSPSAEIREWFHQQGMADALFLFAMTVAEIERGLRSLHRRGGFEKAKRLSLWLDLWRMKPKGEARTRALAISSLLRQLEHTI